VEAFWKRNLPESGESQPQQEDELEDKVEGEPVNNAEEALDDGEEGENNPVLENGISRRDSLVRADARCRGNQK
jgi:hypothetical protein